MVTVATWVPPAPRVRLKQDPHSSRASSSEGDATSDPPGIDPEIDTAVDPAATTVALVGECAASVAACLAELAVTDELTVVYGSDEHGSHPGVHPLVTQLRDLLPRYTIVALYVAPHDGHLGREAELLEELLEVGSLPIVVTPAGAAPQVAAELCGHVRADRALRVDSTTAGEADLRPVWQRREIGGVAGVGGVAVASPVAGRP